MEIAYLASKQPGRFPQKELLHRVPVERHEHVGHWVFFGIAEKGQRLEDVDSAVVGLRELLIEEPQNLLEAILLRAQVKIHEVALGAAARDGTHLHARDVARVGNRNFEERVGWKEYWVGIAEKANFGFLDRNM